MQLSWKLTAVGERFSRVESPVSTVKDGEALVRVAGCGVCHTDISFAVQGVATVHPLPLTLGHEISGIVLEAPTIGTELVGKPVVVPAVMPCGECELCRTGGENVCRGQVMPGNHADGGFSTHVVVPARFLCPVPVDAKKPTDPVGPNGLTLAGLAAMADAVTTPYQAIVNAGLKRGDVAIFVGCGGVGGFGVQLAASIGAHVVAIDIDNQKLGKLQSFGANLTINPKEVEAKEIRKKIGAFAKERGGAQYRWKIFETSGTPAGQDLAFSLLNHQAVLAVVGFTPEKVPLRFSNLMAFEAVAQGNWGCSPNLYPEVLTMVLDGRVQLAPFVEEHPLDAINEVFEGVKSHRITERPILVPEWNC